MMNVRIETQGLLYRLVLDEKMKRLKELIIDLAPPVFCDEREASCSQLDTRDYELMNRDQKKVMKRLEQTEDYLNREDNNNRTLGLRLSHFKH